MPVFNVNNYLGQDQAVYIGLDTADVFNIQDADSFTVRLFGNGGNDLYFVTEDWYDFLDYVVINDSSGIDTIRFDGESVGLGFTYNLDPSIEHLILDVNGGGDFGTINGNSSANLINFNGSGSSALNGGAGNDTLVSGDGDDTLNGGAGIDSMSGGVGEDRYVVDVTGDVVVESPEEGYDTIESTAAAYTLPANVEALVLMGSANINGTGNASDNYVQGNDGNNSISGLAGSDELDGGYGNDTLLGGAGNDDLYGDYGNDSLSGEADHDELYGYDGNDTLLGGLGHDSLYGQNNNDSMVGDAGNDSLEGASGNDTLLGGAGDDTLNGGSGVDLLDGGDGNDLIYVDEDSSTDNVQGGGGDDEIWAYDGDLVNAGLGNDTIYSYSDNVQSASLDGGAGEDTLYLEHNGEFAAYSMHANTENLFLDGEGLDITGNASANYIEGDGGNDTLRGGGGNDVLFGEGGTDRLFGGAGSDTYILDENDTAVELLAGDGTADTVWTMGNTYVLGDFIEHLFAGEGEYDFFGRGNALNNSITGTDNSNTLIGMAGNDTLDALGGEGVLIGGTGNDTYRVSMPSFYPWAETRIVELNNEGTDTVVYSGEGNPFVLGSNLEVLVLTGGDWSNGTGNSGNNTILGDAGFNMIDGGRGNDSMAGGGDSDFYTVDSSADIVTEAPGQGDDDMVYSSVSYTLTTNVEHLELLEAGRINGTGNASNNDIEGNYSANVLSGLAGNDDLEGNRGNDTLLGGEGNDDLDGGAGADSMAGGNGDDSYWVNQIADVVNETGTTGTDEVYSSLVNYTLGTNVENLWLNGPATAGGTGNGLNNRIIDNWGNSNTLTGADGNDTLQGAGGNDMLNGGAGNDSLDGGSGADTMVGGTGTGNDTFMVDTVGDVLSEIGGEGIDTVISTVSFVLANDTVTGVFEHLILEGSDSISGTGNALGNSITGNSGNNVLDGGDNNDTVLGNAGHDTIYGGTSTVTGTASGNDLLDGGAGDDVLFGGNGNDTLLGAGDNDNLMGEAGNDSLNGGAGHDSLDGSYGNDALVGDAGNDTLVGGTGNDTMTGGTGDDWYYVDASLDVVSETGGSGIDDVYSTVSFTLQGGLENLELFEGAAINGIGNGENNDIEGNSNNNSLNGAAGNDTLEGNGGNDTLNADVGNDSLYGGSGNDSMLGGAGNDSLEGGGENDTMLGDAGNDSLVGGDGNDNLTGGDGNDVLSGSGGVNTFSGGAGNDVINYEDTGEGTILADAGGFDIVNLYSVYGEAGTTVFNAGDLSIEEVRYFNNTGDVSILANGGTVNNLFRGIGMGNDYTMDGGGGSDTLEVWTDGESGPHMLTGGDGTDLVLLVTSAGLADTVNTFTVETVDITGGGSVNINDDALTGVVTYLVDDYFGTLGLGSAATGEGEDMTIRLGENFDFSLNLGEGIDTATIISEGLADAGEAAITLYTGPNTVKITGDAALSIYTQSTGPIELENFNATRISFGEGGNNPTLLNLTLDNVNTQLNVTGFYVVNLEVASNSEILLNSVLDESGDRDINFSGAGDLTLNILDADQTLDFGAYEGNLTLDVVNSELVQNFDFIMGQGEDQVFSGEGNDTFDFAENDNSLTYDDEIFGGEGFDSLTADISGYDEDPAGRTFNINEVESITFNAVLQGEGVDTALRLDLAGIEDNGTIYLTGGTGNDAGAWTIENLRVSLNASESGMALDLTFGEGGIDVLGTDYNDTIVMEEDSTSGNVEIDGGSGNDSITANDADDNLEGDSGNDTITGGAGNDAITGGNGVDSLIGGDGADDFYFAEDGTGNADAIDDFMTGVDQIFLDNAYFTGLGPTTGTLGEGMFAANPTGQATDGDDVIVYNTSTGELFYDLDGNAPLPGVLIATLLGDGETFPTLAYSDIEVFNGVS